MRIPIRIAAWTPFARSADVMMMPNIVRIVQIPVVWMSTCRRSTSPTRVAPLLVMILPPCRAMKAMKMPMPTATAVLREKGMLLKSFSRTEVRVRARKMRPSTNTVQRANCQL